MKKTKQSGKDSPKSKPQKQPSTRARAGAGKKPQAGAQATSDEAFRELLGPGLFAETLAECQRTKFDVPSYVSHATSHLLWQDEFMREQCPEGGLFTHVPLDFHSHYRLNMAAGPKPGDEMAFIRKAIQRAVDESEQAKSIEASAVPPAIEQSGQAQGDAPVTELGWVEAHGFQPGVAKKPDTFHEGDSKHGWIAPLPGLSSIRRWSEAEVLRLFMTVILDTSEMLGRHVLPKLATAYDVAEFADLLWTANALAESTTDGRNMISIRDGLGDEIGPKEPRLIDFFSEVLCVRAPEILRHGLPHAGPRARARLVEALALAEMREKATIEIVLKRRQSMQENATPLQRQAWEERARAWLWRDCWDYGNREILESCEGLKPEGKAEVAA